ncbi:MAG: hypothetical protein AAF564_02795 [Bacteroidota bacterium]
MTDSRVVAIDPTSHGYGFVVFEGPAKLVDWGHTQIRPAGRTECLESIAQLLAWYNPAVVVLEDWQSPKSRRSKRVKNLISDLVDFIMESKAEVECYSTHEIARSFSSDGQITKHEIAKRLAESYPELSSKLPPKRRIWKSEDERSSIFDAAAQALTYYYTSRQLLEFSAP